MEESTKSSTQASNPLSRWSRPLARPVALRRGSNLVTLAKYETTFSNGCRGNSAGITELAARDRVAEVAEVTVALEMAASMDKGSRQPRPK